MIPLRYPQCLCLMIAVFFSFHVDAARTQILLRHGLAPLWRGCRADSNLSGSSDPYPGASSPPKVGKETKEHLIEWFVSDREEPIRFKARHGELLRTAALRRGIVSPHNGRSRLINCRGLGTCGTCAVEVPKAGPRNAIENVRLGLPPHGSELQSPALHLACQVIVGQDLQVWKRAGFWGQDPSRLAEFTPVKTYFGQLEFVTDQVSPNEEKK